MVRRLGHRHPSHAWFVLKVTSFEVSGSREGIQDAERERDSEVAELLRKARAESRKGAEQGKALLRSRLGS
jgi:hypothetical protein